MADLIRVGQQRAVTSQSASVPAGRTVSPLAVAGQVARGFEELKFQKQTAKFNAWADEEYSKSVANLYRFAEELGDENLLDEEEFETRFNERLEDIRGNLDGRVLERYGGRISRIGNAVLMDGLQQVETRRLQHHRSQLMDDIEPLIRKAITSDDPSMPLQLISETFSRAGTNGVFTPDEAKQRLQKVADGIHFERLLDTIEATPVNDMDALKESFESGQSFPIEDPDLFAKGRQAIDTGKVKARNDLVRLGYANIRLNPLGSEERVEQDYKGVLEEHDYKNLLAYARDQERSEKERLSHGTGSVKNQILVLDLYRKAAKGQLTEEDVRQKVKDGQITGAQGSGLLDRNEREIEQEIAELEREIEQSRKDANLGENFFYREKASKGLFTSDDALDAISNSIMGEAEAFGVLDDSLRVQFAEKEKENQAIADLHLQNYGDKFREGIATFEDAQALHTMGIKSQEWVNQQKEAIERRNAAQKNDVDNAFVIKRIIQSNGPYDPKDPSHQKAAETELSSRLTLIGPNASPKAKHQLVIDVTSKYGFVPEQGRKMLRSANGVDPELTIQSKNYSDTQKQEIATRQTMQLKSAISLLENLPPIARSQIPSSEIETLVALRNIMDYQYERYEDGTDNFPDIFASYKNRLTMPEFAQDAREVYVNSADFESDVVEIINEDLESKDSWFRVFQFNKDIQEDNSEAFSLVIEESKRLYKDNPSWSIDDAVLSSWAKVGSFAGETSVGFPGSRNVLYSPEVTLSHLYNRKITRKMIDRDIRASLESIDPLLKKQDYRLEGEPLLSDPRQNTNPEWLLLVDQGDGVMKPIPGNETWFWVEE